MNIYNDDYDFDEIDEAYEHEFDEYSDIDLEDRDDLDEDNDPDTYD